MPTIEFTDAEILHLYSDAVRSPMVGPRLHAWQKIAQAADDVLKTILPDEDEED